MHKVFKLDFGGLLALVFVGVFGAITATGIVNGNALQAQFGAAFTFGLGLFAYLDMVVRAKV